MFLPSFLPPSSSNSHSSSDSILIPVMRDSTKPLLRRRRRRRTLLKDSRSGSRGDNNVQYVCNSCHQMYNSTHHSQQKGDEDEKEQELEWKKIHCVLPLIACRVCLWLWLPGCSAPLPLTSHNKNESACREVDVVRLQIKNVKRDGMEAHSRRSAGGIFVSSVVSLFLDWIFWQIHWHK